MKFPHWTVKTYCRLQYILHAIIVLTAWWQRDFRPMTASDLKWPVSSNNHVRIYLHNIIIYSFPFRRNTKRQFFFVLQQPLISTSVRPYQHVCLTQDYNSTWMLTETEKNARALLLFSSTFLPHYFMQGKRRSIPSVMEVPQYRNGNEHIPQVF